MVAALSSTLDPQGLADSLVPVSLTASEVPALEPPRSAEIATKSSPALKVPATDHQVLGPLVVLGLPGVVVVIVDIPVPLVEDVRWSGWDLSGLARFRVVAFLTASEVPALGLPVSVKIATKWSHALKAAEVYHPALVVLVVLWGLEVVVIVNIPVPLVEDVKWNGWDLLGLARLRVVVFLRALVVPAVELPVSVKIATERSTVNHDYYHLFGRKLCI